jgi:hypothetical protein
VQLYSYVTADCYIDVGSCPMNEALTAVQYVGYCGDSRHTANVLMYTIYCKLLNFYIRVYRVVKRMFTYSYSMVLYGSVVVC